jgi:hypothetical protein
MSHEKSKPRIREYVFYRNLTDYIWIKLFNHWIDLPATTSVVWKNSSGWMYPNCGRYIIIHFTFIYNLDQVIFWYFTFCSTFQSTKCTHIGNTIHWFRSSSMSPITDCYDRTEILLKVALNTIKPTKPTKLVSRD